MMYLKTRILPADLGEDIREIIPSGTISIDKKGGC